MMNLPEEGYSTEISRKSTVRNLIDTIRNGFSELDFAIESAKDCLSAFRMLEAPAEMLAHIMATLEHQGHIWTVFDINAPTEDDFVDMKLDLQAISAEYTQSGLVFLHPMRRWVLVLHGERCLPILFRYQRDVTCIHKLIVGENAGYLVRLSEIMRQIATSRQLSASLPVDDNMKIASNAPVRDAKWKIGGIVDDNLS